MINSTRVWIYLDWYQAQTALAQAVHSSLGLSKFSAVVVLWLIYNVYINVKIVIKAEIRATKGEKLWQQFKPNTSLGYTLLFLHHRLLLPICLKVKCHLKDLKKVQ